MIEQTLFEVVANADRALVRGVVTAVISDYRFVVLARQGNDAWPVVADLVVTSTTPLRPAVGDSVLCVLEENDRESGFVVGRIGPPVPSVEAAVPAAPATAASDPAELQDTLVIEARHALTLRVGEGSITIREDGKILIKGKDLVSHAQRTNRIKGGAVAIN